MALVGRGLQVRQFRHGDGVHLLLAWHCQHATAGLVQDGALRSQKALTARAHSMRSQHALTACTHSTTHSMHSQYTLTARTHSMHAFTACTHSMHSAVHNSKLMQVHHALCRVCLAYKLAIQDMHCVVCVAKASICIPVEHNMCSLALLRNDTSMCFGRCVMSSVGLAQYRSGQSTDIYACLAGSPGYSCCRGPPQTAQHDYLWQHQR